VGRWLKEHDEYDLIFVPTVSVHHLLGWHWLLKKLLPRTRTRVLLYFLSMPIAKTGDEKPRWISSPTTQLLQKLFGWLQTAVKSGRVILGVETKPLKEALESLTGLRVHYLAQPVEAFTSHSPPATGDLLMGCYGGARCEKGSELLQLAVARYLELYPQSRARFAIQWIDDLQNEKGEWVRIDPALAKNHRVTYIREYFGEGDYARWLGETGVMLLPYQRASYNLRGSRVVIEAMIHGIPTVVTRGTTLAEQAEQFGAAVLCEDGNVENLVQAMHYAEENIPALRERAERQKAAARAHFSVSEFRRSVLASV
jgi:glycosyltransferase involved in cell wall biosynthesis